jgi:hypothetical protein
MDDWEWVFFYNEEHNNVESVTTFHQLECDIGPLAEAHPEIIYFYAEFGPLKEWDFNEVHWIRETDSVVYHDDIPMVLRREQQRPDVPSGIYWSTPADAMIAPFEPETPCRQFETRPCVELSEDEGQRYRVMQCAPGGCRRFPNRDQREQRGEQAQPGEEAGAPN